MKSRKTIMNILLNYELLLLKTIAIDFKLQFIMVMGLNGVQFCV